MKDTENLEKLLDSLRKEGPFREASRWKGVRPDSRSDAPFRPETDYERPGRKTPDNPNIVWSENKEAILMGMLVSVCVIITGALSGIDYIALLGGISFAVFSLIMAWVIVEYCLCFRKAKG